MKWKTWIKAALIRAVKTAAQAAIVALPTTSWAIGDVDWILILGIAGGGFVLSLLTSLAGIPEVNDGVSPLKGDDDYVN